MVQHDEASGEALRVVVVPWWRPCDGLLELRLATVPRRQTSRYYGETHSPLDKAAAASPSPGPAQNRLRFRERRGRHSRPSPHAATAVDEESSDGSIVEIEQELSLTAHVKDEEDDGNNSLSEDTAGKYAKYIAIGRTNRGDDDEGMNDDPQDYACDIEEPYASCDEEEREEGAVCDCILGDDHADADDEDELELVDKEDDNDAVMQRVASQVVAAAPSSDGERCTRKANTRSELSRGGRHAELEKTIAWLLDPIKRLEDRDKQLADFVDPKFRNTSDVPKGTGKLFLRRRAEKFASLFDQYRVMSRLAEIEEHLQRVFELFIADLTRFDHAKEAFADLVEAVPWAVVSRWPGEPYRRWMNGRSHGLLRPVKHLGVRREPFSTLAGPLVDTRGMRHPFALQMTRLRETCRTSENSRANRPSSGQPLGLQEARSSMRTPAAESVVCAFAVENLLRVRVLSLFLDAANDALRDPSSLSSVDDHKRSNVSSSTTHLFIIGNRSNWKSKKEKTRGARI
ncbi:uncharacterized protein PAN0_002c0994 [Moesziomyces antarcticus]|uniref:Uncharacterized protein n=1 Tax=Pseudozyma antarctica TaxID=84753 RepID=A0A5C3FH49_PSEA2|nr:uncharacterized protein PAN0_002c0994 [Moesziomyces antarcticus]GAK62792.1 hypothetical protein PAN0_002c0994 [Moesziomyces antarcticus]SPO43732.1 uncharacterized protein PSANT_01417 [Moesziomyces antarcticus]